MRSFSAGEFGQMPVFGFHLDLQPGLLFRPLNVHVFGADLAAVGGAQQFHHLAQRHLPARTEGVLQRADEEVAVEIPDGEAVGERVEFRVVRRLPAEGIEFGHQVSANAVGVDELNDGRFLDDFGRRFGDGWPRAPVAFPSDGRVGDFQGFEDFVVEASFAVEQRLELARGTCRIRRPG